MAIEKRVIGNSLEVEIETRDLTNRELVALYHLSEAWNAFYDPNTEPDPHEHIDLEEFMHAVNAAQNVIMARKFSSLSITPKEEE